MIKGGFLRGSVSSTWPTALFRPQVAAEEARHLEWLLDLEEPDEVGQVQRLNILDTARSARFAAVTGYSKVRRGHYSHPLQSQVNCVRGTLASESIVLHIIFVSLVSDYGHV